MSDLYIPTLSEVLDFGRGRRKLTSPSTLLQGVGGPSAAGGGGIAPNDASIVANLVAWFEPSGLAYANNDPASLWTDHAATPHNFTAAGAARPTYKTGGPGGYAYLDFDGVANQMVQATYTLNQPLHYFLVMRPDGLAQGNDRVLGSFNGNLSCQMLFGNADLNIYSGGFVTVTNGFINNTWQLIIANFNGASSFLSSDSNTPASGNVGGNNAAGLAIGANGSGVTPGKFQATELAVYNTTLSAGSVTSLIAGFNTKYGTLA